MIIYTIIDSNNHINVFNYFSFQSIFKFRNINLYIVKSELITLNMNTDKYNC